jgi:hypothetical protein
MPTGRCMFSIVIVHALRHIFKIEVEHACGETVDQHGFPVVVFLVAFVAFMFFIAAQVRLFFLDQFAHGPDFLLADPGLVQAVGADRGLEGTVELGGKGRIEQLHSYPGVHVGLDAFQRHGSIERVGDGDGGDGGVAWDEVILPKLLNLILDSTTLAMRVWRPRECMQLYSCAYLSAAATYRSSFPLLFLFLAFSS